MDSSQDLIVTKTEKRGKVKLTFRMSNRKWLDELNPKLDQNCASIMINPLPVTLEYNFPY